MTKNERQWLETYLTDKEKELKDCINYYREHGDKKAESEIQQKLSLFRDMEKDLRSLLLSR